MFLKFKFYHVLCIALRTFFQLIILLCSMYIVHVEPVPCTDVRVYGCTNVTKLELVGSSTAYACGLRFIRIIP